MKTTVLSGLLCFLFYTGNTQPINNYCEGAIMLDEEFLAEFCVDNGWRNIDASLKDAVPSPNLSGCVLAASPSVWYVIPATGSSYLLSFKLTGPDGSEPAMQVFSGECNALQVVKDCAINYYGPLFIMDIPAEPMKSYYIVVGDAANQSDSLKLHWNKRSTGTPCVTIQDLKPVYRSGDQPVTGPYFPGDTIGFNYSVYFQVSTGGQNCQWMQGVVPVFGSGWDVSSFNPTGEPVVSSMNGSPYPALNVYNDGYWQWWNDVHYHHPHCDFYSGDFDGNGTLDMCDNRYDPDCTGEVFTGGCCGPCWDQDSGDLLPGGWFTAGVNGSCGGQFNWPAVDWGDGNTCSGLTGPWDFYFELIVPVDMASDHGNFSIVMHTFADGEVGSWTGGPSVCGADYPARFDASVLLECDEEAGRAYLSGKLFGDFESDCSYEGNEPGVPHRVISIRSVSTGLTRLLLTNESGRFLTEIDTGSYWIVPVLDGVEPEQCPDSVLIQIPDPCEFYELNFPVDNDLLCTELVSLHVTSGPLRICETSVVTIALNNGGGLELLNPEILFELDSLLELESATVSFETLGDNMFLFHAPDLPARAMSLIRLRVKTSCAAPFGYDHCSTATLTNPACTTQEISDEWCMPNGAAIDPNFKVDGNDFSFGITPIIDASQIEYQIHFQNTGTSYAERVTILDTLPELLDPTTLKFKGSSHAVEISLIDNHILQFFFANIFLPDSTTDEAASHGVIVFGIQPIEGLVVGQTVLNNAAIYFDFSAPVITNQKEHVVVCEAEFVFDSISLALDNGTGDGAVYLFPPEGIEYTYAWSNGGSSNSIVNVISGEYSVTITDGSGCIQILSFEVLLNTGVHDEQTIEVSVRPNPANERLHLDFAVSIHDIHVCIYSIDGRMLWSVQLSDVPEYEIPIGQLSPSMYLIEIRSGSEIKMMKFLKM